LLEWDENGELVRTPAEIWASTGQCPIVLITHDECIFHANDGPTHVWTLDDCMPLRKKGHRQGIMISEFVSGKSRVCAPSSISDEKLSCKGLPRYALESLEFGGETWWTGDQLMAQTLNKTISLVTLQYPGCQALFLFDNARNHDSFAPDALRVNQMNLGSGGESPPANMRNGWFYDKQGRKWSQPMNWPEYPTTSRELWGKPKGLKVILQERGLWHDGLRLKCKTAKDCDPKKPGGCCARTLLSIQEDFKAQKSMLQEAVESRGHLSLLYPKFHCELNWIEHFWGAAKWHTRKNCRYSIQDLRERIPQGIEYAEKYIQASWKRVEKIINAYRAGIGWTATTGKKYKSHRRVSDRHVSGQYVI
jgi:transposase